ncbi:hypothetical protein ACFPL7_07515 [Dongia soli]|uniref:Uncharacterized protein n=1 Tax=Dongia soli TaxID=600628 RepID=A0ABU5E8Z0_9PROT|nr:hypothetical protein [Dongia soli]MDY0882793.1 hypothetical protein [Dongia soli]
MYAVLHRSFRAVTVSIAAIVAFGWVTISGDAWAKTTQTIRAFSVWHAQGKLPDSATTQSIYKNVIAGPLYVDTEKGPVSAGKMTCKAILQVNQEDRTQSGSADCTLMVKDGAEVTAKLDCKGVFMVGCSGNFTLVGGSGPLKNIKGGGKVIIRSEFADARARGTQASAVDLQSGILYLPALTYELP